MMAWGPEGATRGTCRTCGKPARKASAFYCQEHAPQATPKKDKEPVSVDKSTIEVKRPEDTKDDKKDTSGNEGFSKSSIEKFLRTTGNEFLVTAMVVTCQPVAKETWLEPNGKPTELAKQVLLNDLEISVLADSISKVKNLPMLSVASSMLAPLMPWLGLGACAVVVSLHAQRMIRLRSEVLKIAVSMAEDTKQNEQSESNEQPPTQQPVSDI